MLLITFPFILVLTVTVHYLFLSNMAVIFETKWSQSTKLVLIICGLFIAHIMEIIVYAMVYYHSDYMLNMGEAKGSFQQWLDALYFSFVAYSSLGAGELSLPQPLMLLYGLEAINGLLLIAWSASFSLLAMNRVHFCDPCITTGKNNMNSRHELD